MLAGIWSALTNCEICIYDKSWCGCFSSHCCSRKPRHTDNLYNHSPLPPASQELKNHANNSGCSVDLTNSVLSEYDVIPSPDPTSSVSIFRVPRMPRYADHLEDD